MKKSVSILSLILALLISVSCLVACDTEKETQANSTSSPVKDNSESQSETDSEYHPDVKENNYKESFFLQIQPQSNRVEYYWVEESSNDVLSQAIYTRQQELLDYLGVEMIGVEVDGHDQYGTVFTTAVKNKDGSVDTLLSHSYMSLTEFISRGYLTDFQNIAEINLDADYWNLEVMEGVATGSHLYLGYSDFRLGFTNVITFNKTMMEKYADDMNESIYEMVSNYHWTIDSMSALAKKVYIDTNSDGKTEDDTFGITGRQWENFTNFLQASDIQLVEANEKGEYTVSINSEKNNEKTENLINKIKALAVNDCSMFAYQGSSTEIISVTGGKTLMQICSTLELPVFLNSEVSFGVLPFPMYDEAQKDVGYRSLDWGGWLCIPSYMENEEMIGDTLEMMAYYSKNVQTAYYEKLLGKQVADMPDDRQMLTIIWNSICSDIGLTYSHMAASLDYILHMVPRLTAADSTENYASYLKSHESSANKALSKFFGKID